jgi:hypothetical protein
MSSTRPVIFSTTVLKVRTVNGAKVTATARYWTENVTEIGVSTHGAASIPFYTSDALPWYLVRVTITAAKPGWRNGTCSTAFRPRLL